MFRACLKVAGAAAHVFGGEERDRRAIEKQERQIRRLKLRKMRGDNDEVIKGMKADAKKRRKARKK
jgi:hypothetical protein